MILGALVIVTIRGLSVGKWVHKAGGVLMLRRSRCCWRCRG